MKVKTVTMTFELVEGRLSSHRTYRAMYGLLSVVDVVMRREIKVIRCFNS